MKGFALLVVALCCLRGALCFCPFRCLCNEDTLTVWCDGAALDVVPITLNPGLKELHLNGNRIKGIAASFTVYQHLRFLDMSANLLTSLGQRNFLEQKQLKVLHLHDNRVTVVKATAFEGLVELKALRLDGNAIAEVQEGAFATLEALESLDLSRNALATLSEGSFEGLSGLKELVLRDNKLTRVPEESLRPLRSLKSLDLGMNAIYLVPKGAFLHLRRLEALSLDGCGIHIIETGAFAGLDAIASLFLQDNELEKVPTEVLADVPSLQELHVGKNRLRRLDFRGMRQLRTISVKGEDEALDTLENGTFADNHELERLVISQNKGLSRVESGAFSGLDKLRFLSLRGNQFTTFREDMLPWGKLDAFDVRENPLDCNCSLRWLWQLLRRGNFSSSTLGEDVTRVRCKGPPPLLDRLLVDLDDSLMDCNGGELQLVLAALASALAILLAVAGLAALWHRYRYAARQKSKLGHSKRTLYQYGQNSDHFSPILSQIGQPPFKNPAIAEL